MEDGFVNGEEVIPKDPLNQEGVMPEVKVLRSQFPSRQPGREICEGGQKIEFRLNRTRRKCGAVLIKNDS